MAPFLFPFLFLNEIGENKLVPPKVVGAILEIITPDTRKPQTVTYDNFDDILNRLLDEGVITLTVVNSIKRVIMPTLYHSFIQQLKEMNKISRNPENPTEFYAKITWTVPKDNNGPSTVTASFASGSQRSLGIPIENANIPGEEKIQSSYLKQHSWMNKQIPDRRLDKLSPEDLEQTVTWVSQPESKVPTEEELEALRERFHSYVLAWIETFNKTHNNQSLEISKTFNKALGNEVSQHYIGNFFWKNNPTPTLLRFNVEFTTNDIAAVEFDFYFTLPNDEQYTSIVKELPRSHDPHLKRYFDGFVGMKKLADQCMKTFYNAIQKHNQKTVRAEIQKNKEQNG